MTLKEAMQAKVDRIKEERSSSAEEKRCRRLAEKRMKDIRWKVCNCIDCDSCPAFERWTDMLGGSHADCNAQTGSGACRLEAVELLERWIAQYDAEATHAN
jgi:hypothetical protein